MDICVNELKCLMCGHVVGYLVQGKQGVRRFSATAGQCNLRSPRCPRCSGPLYLDPSYEEPRELGIDVTKLFSDGQPEPVEIHAERRCISCGAPVQRAERCRRCYLRHRYATNPSVRAKQLALQARWRHRQAIASSRGMAAMG